jgi:hypothetical protein
VTNACNKITEISKIKDLHHQLLELELCRSDAKDGWWKVRESNLATLGLNHGDAFYSSKNKFFALSKR